MPLPNLLNDVPKFQIVVPSTKKELSYRPFLVKEQKILMMALESQDTKQIVQSMLDCVQSCVPDSNPTKMPIFDIDYIFTQIRSKSIGETSEITHTCRNDTCDHQTKITVKLNDIKLKEDVPNNIIDLNDKIKIKMKYPTYVDMLNNEHIFSETSSGTETLFETILICLDTVSTEDEQIKISDESKESVNNFVETLTQEQLTKLQEFVSNMPSLTHQEEYKCEKCGTKNTVSLQGVRDFFS